MSLTRGRWSRQGSQCPEWCAKDHQCTAGRAVAGEHRSSPLSWRLPYGRLVATRVASASTSRRDRLEVRATVRLPEQEEAAAACAHQLAAGIDAVIRRVLGLPPGAGLLRELARQREGVRR